MYRVASNEFNISLMTFDKLKSVLINTMLDKAPVVHMTAGQYYWQTINNLAGELESGTYIISVYKRLELDEVNKDC